MVVVIQCKDAVGLVASIASVMAQHGINISSMREYVDGDADLFFARLQTAEALVSAEVLKAELEAVLPAGALVRIEGMRAKKIVVLATKEHHCLSDLLIRHHFGTLGATVAGVIANHPELGDLCQRFDVPFFYISHEGVSKEAFEEKLLAALHPLDADYVVLAKFMRILSPHLVAQFPLRILNIHHSFLPAFIGASPYRQAWERGVKIIGATAHFVTNDLDEGPIVVQQVMAVNHQYGVQELIRAGRETETAVLAKALGLVLQDRVLVYGNKTVVFE